MSYIVNVLSISIFSYLLIIISAKELQEPIVINTWNFTEANQKAWSQLIQNRSALDAIEIGCSECERLQCDGTVGWGGSPSENGETTLDAMIMDGETYNVGAVGGLRDVKNAISVARAILERTSHTLLVGEMATEFALQLGFKRESLQSEHSLEMNRLWKINRCQPNFWMNVNPDPRKSCGPYKLPTSNDDSSSCEDLSIPDERRTNSIINSHDTIGMLAIDKQGRIASGTSTNGSRNKIFGRVGDSPIPGSGSYAARDAGAAAATGDGDIMMRHLLSFQAIEYLRGGMTANDAAWQTIKNLKDRTVNKVNAAVIVLSKNRTYGAACIGYNLFPYVISENKMQTITKIVKCIDS